MALKWYSIHCTLDLAAPGSAMCGQPGKAAVPSLTRALLLLLPIHMAAPLLHTGVQEEGPKMEKQ